MVLTAHKTGTADQLATVASSLIKDVEAGFNQISTKKDNYSTIKFLLSKTSEQQWKKIMNNWNYLRPELLKYAYKPIAGVYMDN